jgi:outer membrane protein TolC
MDAPAMSRAETNPTPRRARALVLAAAIAGGVAAGAPRAAHAEPAAAADGALPPAGPLEFEAALAEARANVGDVIRAKEDLLLVDVERMLALANVLPRVDLTVTAGEVFLGSPIQEQRIARAPDNPFGCFPIGETSGEDLLRCAYGPFRDFALGNASHPNFTLQLGVQQLLYDGGRWWTQLARVGDSKQARASALALLENDLRARVARAFYGLAQAAESRRVVETQVANDEAQLARVRALLDVGRAKPADVAASVRNLAQDKTDLATRRATERQARRSLNLAIGRRAEGALELALPANVGTSTAPLALAPLPPADRLRAAAATLRPEVQALEAELAQLQKAVTIAEAEYYPTVSLGANMRRGSRRPDRVFWGFDENYTATLDLAVRWNLFQGRGTDARVAEAEINLRKSESKVAELHRNVAGEVDDKLDAYARAAEVFGLSRETLDAAEEALRLARGLFNEGRATLLETRDAELRQLQARLALRTARLDLEIARQELHRAVGADPFDLPTTFDRPAAPAGPRSPSPDATSVSTDAPR